MGWKYWRVVLKYGHVGKRNEISVARFLVTESIYTPVMVMEQAANMPGVKHNGVSSVKEVSLDEFITGKRTEQENFYLRKMKAFHKDKPA
ncbi:hypothetical protein [Domibacillus epiphyticus]|uniref:Uncharacterized protein n=1 Tax=Domibacillus epiphyticus TaxID=1714355 RepID=A0A1V2A622_9BACI|nr:hypothetical protein [Domibacillus epiphyticus]OMP66451.1 hypothetical protein BTO28_12170 [Domibacillus epiphyticus]